MKLFFLGILSIFIISGCGSILKPDPMTPSIKAGYPSAEFKACGKHWVGLGVCSVVIGKDFSDIKLEIPVYYNGTLTVDSVDCTLDVQMTYQGTQEIPILLPGVSSKSCIVSITLSPKYPRQENQTIRVHSLRGHLLIRAIKAGREWEGRIKKVTGSAQYNSKFWVGGNQPVTVVAIGCGRETPYRVDYNLNLGYLELNISDIIPSNMRIKTCVLEGFIRQPIFSDLYFNIFVAKYDETFRTIPIPAIEMSKGKLKLLTEDYVSVVSLNDEYKLSNDVKFKFKKEEYNLIRLITVSGRLKLGIWKVDKAEWEWRD